MEIVTLCLISSTLPHQFFEISLD